jgi:hypothetical protein
MNRRGQYGFLFILLFDSTKYINFFAWGLSGTQCKKKVVGELETITAILTVCNITWSFFNIRHIGQYQEMTFTQGFIYIYNQSGMIRSELLGFLTSCGIPKKLENNVSDEWCLLGCYTVWLL